MNPVLDKIRAARQAVAHDPGRGLADLDAIIRQMERDQDDFERWLDEVAAADVAAAVAECGDPFAG